MVLRVDTYRESYRASFYSPYWIVNSTDLKFEFKVFEYFYFIIKYFSYRLKLIKYLLTILINHIFYAQKNFKMNHINRWLVY